MLRTQVRSQMDTFLAECLNRKMIISSEYVHTCALCTDLQHACTDCFLLFLETGTVHGDFICRIHYLEQDNCCVSYIDHGQLLHSWSVTSQRESSVWAVPTCVLAHT